MSSTESAPAQRTPAWKRLGLKLKPAGPGGPGGPGAAPASPAGSSNVGQPSGSTGHKRRSEAPPSTNGASPLKRPRTSQGIIQNGQNGNNSFGTPGHGSALKAKKSVKFGDTPSKHDAQSPPASRTTHNTKTTSTTETTPKKKAKGPAKKPKKQTPPSTDTKPALEYLRQWRNAREDWKFNKNHQSTLIRCVFEPVTTDADGAAITGIPADDIDTFYDYIQDLKGFVRTRLRETAMEVQMQDVNDGTAGWPQDTMDVDDKQETYDAILADILRRKRQQQEKKDKKGSSPNKKRRFFNEGLYVADSKDGEMIIRRVVKRMRAEMIMEELSDSGEDTDKTMTTTTSSSKTVTNSDDQATTTTGDKQQPSQAKGTEGTSRRRRKLRTNMDDSSSSESESDDDSDDSSSSSSSDDSDSEEEMADQRPDEGNETSSSSSSSSSDEESDSDDDESDEE